MPALAGIPGGSRIGEKPSTASLCHVKTIGPAGSNPRQFWRETNGFARNQALFFLFSTVQHLTD